MPVPGLGEGDALCPQWLPDGRMFLFCRPGGERLGRIFAASIEGNPSPKLMLSWKLAIPSIPLSIILQAGTYSLIGRESYPFSGLIRSRYPLRGKLSLLQE